MTGRAAIEIGKRRYAVLGELGRGGMGRLLLAQREDSAELCVIKEVLEVFGDDPQLVLRSAREAHLSALLVHPNIARLLDAGVRDRRVNLVLEFIAGKTLHEVLVAHQERGVLPPFGLVLAAARGVLAALSYAHALHLDDAPEIEIVHRDLSPQNVMLSYDGAVKVIDFGVARASHLTGITRPGAVPGNPEYYSPEQARGETVDRRSDLYTLGALLYESLTGVPLVPRGLKPVDAAIHVVTSAPPAPPSSHVPSLPPALDAVVLRALEKRRDDRFSTAAELLAALDRAAPGAAASAEDLGRYLRELFASDFAQVAALEAKVATVVPSELTGPSEGAAATRPGVRPASAEGTAVVRDRGPRRRAAADAAPAQPTVAPKRLSDWGCPRSFGRYTLLSLIGQGGSGAVLAAEARQLRDLCAVKLLKDAGEGELKQILEHRVRREAHALARLNHPNVARLIDAGVQDGIFYLATEYLTGCSVEGVLDEFAGRRRTPVPPGVAVYIAASALTGLQHVHEATDETGRPLHLVHRDLGPANVMLCIDGGVKLIDFGLVRTAQLDGFRTLPGRILGTLRYMPPEQALPTETAPPVTAVSDLFAVGAWLWELLSNGPLLPYGEWLEVANAHLDSAPYRALDTERLGLPEGLRAVLRRALERDPADRFPSAAAFRAELLEAASPLGSWSQEEVARWAAPLLEAAVQRRVAIEAIRDDLRGEMPGDPAASDPEFDLHALTGSFVVRPAELSLADGATPTKTGFGSLPDDPDATGVVRRRQVPRARRPGSDPPPAPPGERARSAGGVRSRSRRLGPALAELGAGLLAVGGLVWYASGPAEPTRDGAVALGRAPQTSVVAVATASKAADVAVPPRPVERPAPPEPPPPAPPQAKIEAPRRAAPKPLRPPSALATPAPKDPLAAELADLERAYRPELAERLQRELAGRIDALPADQRAEAKALLYHAHAADEAAEQIQWLRRAIARVGSAGAPP
jgi:serine/threonine-protein kinase